MKNLYPLALLLCCGMILHGQTLTTIDMETQKPIEAVSIISRSSNLLVDTDENGEADISEFKNASDIEVRKLGYNTLIMSYKDLARSSFKIHLQANQLEMEKIVISANRWRQNSGNQPAKIISISGEEIELSNPQTAADLLDISGKVFVQKSQQGGGSPMIRGFATNRLLYTVDGVRMNTAIFRSGNIQNVINIDPYALENTEVLFGPASMMYGSDAIGGVMSFRTLETEFSNASSTLVKGKFGGRFSTANNERTGHFDVKVGWEKWAFVTSFSSWDFDHLRQGSQGPEEFLKPYYVEEIDGMDKVVAQQDPLLQIPSAYSQMNMMQKVAFKANEFLQLSYGLHYSETSPYGRYDRHNRSVNAFPRYGEWNYGPQKWMMNHLGLRYNRPTLFFDEVNVNLALQDFEESRITRNFGDVIRENRIEKVRAYSGNVDLRKSLTKKSELFYGLEYILNDVDSRGFNEHLDNNTTEDGPSRYPNSTWNSYAFYVNQAIKLSDKWLIQGGLRGNAFALHSEFDTAYYDLPFQDANLDNHSITGTIGMVWRPDDTWIFRTSYGTAFRSPNVDDAGKVFDSEPGSVVVPNPDLEAEYARNFDLGFAKIFKKSVRIDATMYYTVLNGAMVRRDDRLNGQDSILYDGVMSKVQTIQNAAVTTVYGIQAGIEIKLPSGFSFTTDVNFQKGEEEMDDGTMSPARHAAPFFGTSRLSYQHNQLKMQVYVKYQGTYSHDELAVSERSKDEIYAHDLDGLTYAPSWATLNVKALYELHHKFDLSAGVENVTDLRYRTYSSGISAPGRNFILSALFKF